MSSTRRCPTAVQHLQFGVFIERVGTKWKNEYSGKTSALQANSKLKEESIVHIEELNENGGSTKK